jgi:type IV pilus assembly protein PilC
MQKFNYRAKDKKGKTLSGMVEAREDKQALALLHDRGLTVISLLPWREKTVVQSAVRAFQKVSFGDVVNFTRQLSTMITAGLSLTDSLSILEIQLSPAMGRVVGDILRRVEGGEDLADSLAKHPKVFSKVYVALVRAGETAGVLDKILNRLANNLEKQRDFNSKVKGALVYPVIVVVGMVVVAAIVMIFVMPKLMTLFEEFEADLPASTRFLMSFSRFMSKFWWLGIFVLFGLSWALSLFKKTKTGLKQYNHFLFQVPLIGALNKKLILTEFTRTLGLLVGAGISIIEALNVVAETTGNEVYKEILGKAAKKVEKGFPLATSLAEETDKLPPIIPQMISVGEETGKVDEVLAKVSSYFEAESEQAIKGLTTAIEPLIIVLLGIGVGFLVIAVIMPIYSLTSQF